MKASSADGSTRTPSTRFRSRSRWCPRPASPRAAARAARGSSRPRDRRARVDALRAAPEIGLRVEQPVDVIDPEAVDLAAFEHLQYARVGVLEHRRELHAQAGEVVDVEEAPVVDLVLGDAEEGDAPELRGDQAVELAPVAVEGGDARARSRERASGSLQARSASSALRPCARSATCGRQCGRSRNRSDIRSSAASSWPRTIG